MPRSVSGNYTLPLPPVVPNTTIEAAWANTTDDDIAQALTDSLDRYGRGGMVAPFRLTDGSQTVPAWAFSAETGTGMWRDGNGILAVSVQGAKVGQWSALGYTGVLAGPFDVTGPVDFDGPLYLTYDVQPITLAGANAAIVWYQAGFNLSVIARDDASGQFSFLNPPAHGAASGRPRCPGATPFSMARLT
jgi:hypothetical protein